MPRPLCIYHKNCLDGSGAAAVVQRHAPDCEFLPMQYTHAPPTVEGRKVYLVDFGFPLAEMRALKAQASELIWADHHASQEPVWRQLGWGAFDLDECGTSLTWKTLFPGKPAPPVIAYIRDKDLWRWELPDSRAICAGLSERFGKSQYAGLLDVDLAEMAALGAPIIAAQRARIVTAAQAGVAISDAFGIRGLRALAVNAFQDQNELGEYICLPPESGGLGYDVAVLYYRKGAGRWVHSLRSAGRGDCATIAAQRGGGGHPMSSCYLADDPIVPLSVVAAGAVPPIVPTA